MTTIKCPHCGKDIELKAVPFVRKKPKKATAKKKKPVTKKPSKKTGGKK